MLFRISFIFKIVLFIANFFFKVVLFENAGKVQNLRILRGKLNRNLIFWAQIFLKKSAL